MALTKKEKLLKILQKIRKIGDVVGSSVVTSDGLQVAADLGDNVDEDTFAAMSSTMLGSAQSAVANLKQGELERIIVEAEHGKIISMALDNKTILVILADPSINLGLALLEVIKTAKDITKILNA